MPKKKCVNCNRHHVLHLDIKPREAGEVDEVILVRGGQRNAYLWLGIDDRCVGMVQGAKLRDLGAAIAKETQRTGAMSKKG